MQLKVEICVNGDVLYQSQSEDDHIFGNATDRDNDYYDGEI